MKKAFLILAVLLSMFVGTGLTVLLKGLYQIREKEEQIIQEVTQNQWLKTVSEVSFFAAEKAYHVARGIDAQGVEKWVWYDGEERYETPAKGLISPEKAVEKARQRYPEMQLLRITPGLFKQRPVWVALLKETGSSQGYVYLYMQMTDGAVVRELRLR